jgi:aminocarboxymuconate-semialdehyde decarboxylase
MTIVDVHTHLIPRFVLDEAAGPGMFGVVEDDGWLVHPEGFRYPITPELIEPAAKLKQMEAHRIDVSIVSWSPTLFFYDRPTDETIEFTRRANDVLARIVSEPRLEGLATLPLQAPELAAAELERSVHELGLKGAQIGTNCGPRSLDDPEFDPVFATAAALGVPLLLHPYYVGSKPGLEEFYLTNSLGNPLDTCLAAVRLIHSGALDRHRGLRLVLAHGGGFLPYQLGRFEHAFRVRAEPRKAIHRPPSDYLRHFWMDTITHRDDALAFLAQVTGVDRLILGTDLPFDMADEDASCRVERVGLDPHTLGETARALFGLA